VKFEEGKGVLPAGCSQEATLTSESSLAQALIARGVSPGVAEDVCASQPAEQIKKQIAVFDSLRARNHRKISKNPPGFLVSSIKDRYAPPKGFTANQTKPREEVPSVTFNIPSTKKSHTGTRRDVAERTATRLAIEEFWQLMPEPERQRRETEVIADATEIERDVIARGKSFANATRKALLDAYALKMLGR